MEFRGVLKNYILHRKHSPNLGHSSRNGRAQFEVLVLFFLAAGSENLERTNIQPRICLTVSSTFDDLALCVCAFVGFLAALSFLPCSVCFVFVLSSLCLRPLSGSVCDWKITLGLQSFTRILKILCLLVWWIITQNLGNHTTWFGDEYSNHEAIAPLVLLC